MKKLLMLGMAVLAFQATPVLAGPHEGGKMGDKMFSSKDTNSDGVISEAEFVAHAKEKFTKMDKDGNGSITKEEAKESWKEKRSMMKEKRLEKKKEMEKMESDN